MLQHFHFKEFVTRAESVTTYSDPNAICLVVMRLCAKHLLAFTWALWTRVFRLCPPVFDLRSSHIVVICVGLKTAMDRCWLAGFSWRISNGFEAAVRAVLAYTYYIDSILACIYIYIHDIWLESWGVLHMLWSAVCARCCPRATRGIWWVVEGTQWQRLLYCSGRCLADIMVEIGQNYRSVNINFLFFYLQDFNAFGPFTFLPARVNMYGFACFF